MALTFTTVVVKTGAGASANVAAVTDGTNTFLLHGTIDTNGNQIVPAQDATMAGATTALQVAAASLQSLNTLMSGAVVTSSGAA